MKLLLFDREISSDKLTPESVTLLTDSALLHPGNPLFVPEFAPGFQIEIMPAAVINRLGKNIPEKFASRYYDSIMFLARLVPVLAGIPLRHGSPDLTNFDNAVAAGQIIPLDSISSPLTLNCNGADIEFDLSRAMFDKAIELTSKNTTLKIGDVIATARLLPTFPAVIDSRIELTIPALALKPLRFKIK